MCSLARYGGADGDSARGRQSACGAAKRGAEVRAARQPAQAKRILANTTASWLINLVLVLVCAKLCTGLLCKPPQTLAGQHWLNDDEDDSGDDDGDQRALKLRPRAPLALVGAPNLDYY